MMQLKYLPVRSGTIDPSTVNTTIHTMLDKEMIENKCTSWNKLDKTHKLTLINKYVDVLAEQYDYQCSIGIEEISIRRT